MEGTGKGLCSVLGQNGSYSCVVDDADDRAYALAGWFLWHINHYRLFNPKSCFYTYILNIKDLV